MQTYLTFDPVSTNATALVSEFVQRLIDVTDLDTVELASLE